MSTRPRPATSSSAPACTASRPPTTSPWSCGSAVTARAPTSLVLEKSTPGRGRDGHRLRRRPQQLLPARDERADAGVRRGLGVGSRGLPLQPRRLHRARRRGAGARPHRGPRAPRADRLPLRADHRRARGRRPHEGALPRLARAGRHRLPARAPGRLRVQPRVRRGPRATSASPRACRSSPHTEVTGLRARRRRQRHRRRDRPGAVAVGEQVVSRPGRGRSASGRMLGLPDDDRHPHAVRRRRPRPADVDVLEPPGGRDHRRPADVRDRRRRRAARDPPRHRRAALHRRRPARHRRALGHLLQARPPRRPGRRLTAHRRRRRRARPVPVDHERRRRVPRHVVRGALARDEPLRGLPRRCTSRRARAASARSPPTTSRSSTT